MAKRNDFAQKLLDDLRLRKERMATSHTVNRSNQTSGIKYQYFTQSSRGPRKVNPHETIGTSSRDMRKWIGTGNKSLAIYEPSKEIVSVERGRSSEHIADLSMAIAFALNNGRNLGKMDSSSNNMSGFLQHLGRRSVNYGEMDRRSLDRSWPSNGRFPTLSHLHIKEISKGAQKLNQILKACCNGVNLDKCSIDIGRELLKGALDLEESLKLLVDLQEASEYMVSPRKKQQIRLIEIEDDDEEIAVEVNKQKQLDRPKFSFDRPSRNSREDARGVTKDNLLKQRLLALSYCTEAPHVISEKQAPIASSNLVSHRRSASCGPYSSIVTAFSSPKKHLNSSDSQAEKGRIPNVIAKLMGLEELPPTRESKNGAQKDMRAKQGTRASKDSKKNLHESTKKVEPMTMNSVKLAPQTDRQKMMRSNKNLLETVSCEGKSHCKDLNTEDIKPVPSTKKPEFKINRPQINMAQLNQNTEIMMDKQEKKRRQENQNPREQKSQARVETKEPVTKDDFHRMTPQTHKNPEAADDKHEKVGTKEIAPQKEKKDADNRLSMARNQQKLPHDSPPHLPHMLRKSKSQEAKLPAVERKTQNVKHKLQVKTQKRSEMMLKNSSKPTNEFLNLQKKLPYINHAMPSKRTSTVAFDAKSSKRSLERNQNEDLIGEGNSTSFKLNMKKAPSGSSEEQRPSSRGTETQVENLAVPIPQFMITKSDNVPPIHKKVDNTQVNNSVDPRKIEEIVIRENSSPHNMSKPLEQQISVLQELKQRRHNRIKSEEAEVSISTSKEVGVQPLNFKQDLQKSSELTSISSNPMGEEHQRPKELGTLSPNATIQDITTKVSDTQKASTKSSYTVSIPIEGLQEHSMTGISESLPEEEQKIPQPEKQGSLTEDENHLKEILIKSQLFLNAAEALFRLQVPVGILHASSHKYQDDDSKLVLDCGYEVMKRKGRRQEVFFHPYATISIGSVKVKCLDDLVKELHKDLETLKFCAGSGGNEYDAADCLHNMLQKDIQNKNSDVNCMWDSGWSDMMFAHLEKEEVIRDLEKHVLNILIDEITTDFYM